MRYDTLDFNFLSVVCVRVASRNAQLNCPAIDVVQRATVVKNCEHKCYSEARLKLCNQMRKKGKVMTYFPIQCEAVSTHWSAISTPAQ